MDTVKEDDRKIPVTCCCPSGGASLHSVHDQISSRQRRVAQNLLRHSALLTSRNKQLFKKILLKGNQYKYNYTRDVMISPEAEEELMVVESVFCVGGEFHRMDQQTFKIRFVDQGFVTFQLDHIYPQTNPQMSVSAELLTRNQNQIFAEELRDFVASLDDGDQKLLAALDFAKEKYESFKIDHEKEFKVVDSQNEMIIVKIDHMRNSGNYVKTLEDWTELFSLTGVLVISKDEGIVLMLEGEKYGISRFVQNWKSVNIDIDSRGKPCKEKMIQILYRKETTNLLLNQLSKDKFSFIKTDKFCDYFAGFEINDLIKSIFI